MGEREKNYQTRMGKDDQYMLTENDVDLIFLTAILAHVETALCLLIFLLTVCIENLRFMSKLPCGKGLFLEM